MAVRQGLEGAGMQRPMFLPDNYRPCLYCRNVIITGEGPEVSYYCARFRRDKAYAGIIERGCTSLEASGLPAHPAPRAQMVRNLSQAERIPEDELAEETGFAFMEKMKRYPHSESATAPPTHRSTRHFAQRAE